MVTHPNRIEAAAFRGGGFKQYPELDLVKKGPVSVVCAGEDAFVD